MGSGACGYQRLLPTGGEAELDTEWSVDSYGVDLDEVVFDH
jgi:hypothetical protein